jgi:hypothetical protein
MILTSHPEFFPALYTEGKMNSAFFYQKGEEYHRDESGSRKLTLKG